MKKLLLFLSFLLFNAFLSFAAEKPNPVLDSDGEEIRPGVEYYVVSVIRGGGGGGVAYGCRPDNCTCPLAVVQERSDLNQGHPVTFTPEYPEEGVVRVSTDLNIKFSEANHVCVQSNVWRLDIAGEVSPYFILTDGVEGNPGCENVFSWFKIEQADERAYKLVVCPDVCDIVKVACRDVSIFHDQNGDRRLGLSVGASYDPFRVVFRKKNKVILSFVTST